METPWGGAIMLGFGGINGNDNTKLITVTFAHWQRSNI